jgi:CheY-like chemotaxis protein
VPKLVNNETPILYVEDEEADAFLMRIAVRRAGLLNPLKVVVDGVMAIEYLAGAGPFADRMQHPFPALVLLDLNLPRKTGFEVLKWIREQPAYPMLPVIVYTSSAEESDRKNAHHLGANKFITKMSDVNQLVALLRTLCP